MPPKNEGFLGSSNRFEGFTGHDEKPGPGAYGMPSSLQFRSRNRADNMSFATTAERFTDAASKTTGPGPAAYASGEQSWGRKSYNILFNRDL